MAVQIQVETFARRPKSNHEISKWALWNVGIISLATGVIISFGMVHFSGMTRKAEWMNTAMAPIAEKQVAVVGHNYYLTTKACIGAGYTLVDTPKCIHGAIQLPVSGD